MITFRFLALTVLLALAGGSLSPSPALAQSCEYWVAPAPEGDDNNPGGFDQPWATIDHAANNVPDDTCTVWFKDGVYTGENDLYEQFTTLTTFKAVTPYKAVLQAYGHALHLRGARNMLFEGFEFRHAGPNSTALIIEIHRRDNDWTENVTFRNNIIHDSYNNDLFKIYNGSRFITIENNIFYNQGGSEQQLDVNSVTDVVIQDNIFFNDFAGSGRDNQNNTKHFIVIKDSNEDFDGLLGSERITVRRNLFLNWEGGIETFIKVGNDGKPYFEAKDVHVENNLMIGNSHHLIGAAFGISGARDVSYVNNTVVGDLPASAYAFKVTLKDLNPKNENIYFYNNIWSDPTGTMGSDGNGSPNEFSDGDPGGTTNLILDNNFYWNGGVEIPEGDLVSPVIDDARRVIGDPLLRDNQANIVLPRWNGTNFLSGKMTIHEEFIRLVELYAKIPYTSPAIGQADPTFAPTYDILGRPRSLAPAMGAYEGSVDGGDLIYTFLPVLIKGIP